MIEQWCSCFPDHLFPEVNNSPATSVDALTASPPQSGDTYFVRRVVGSGATGTALIGRRERDSLAIIAKVVDLGEMDPGQRERTESEIECLSRCRHSAIIQYLTHHLVGTKLLLVMELADAGDLGFQIKHRRETRAHFLEQEVALMLAQILIAVDYIHSQGILHRDIKPANVFVKTNGLVKIGDFGLSKIFEETVSKNVASSLVGTPYYLAPEVWHREKYGKKADMFSIGVLWYEMLTLERPFKGSSVTAVMEAITSGVFAPLPSHLGSDCVALVTALLSRNPEERPSIVEVFERPLMDHAFRIFSSIIVQGLPVSAAARESVQRDALVLRRKIQQHVDAKYPPPKEGCAVQTPMMTPIVHLEDGKKWKHRALKLSTNGFLLVGKSVEALSSALDESGAEYLCGSTSASDMGKSTSATRAIPIADVFAVNEVPRCFSEGRPNVFAVILRSTDEALWFYSAVDASLTATWMKTLSEAIGRPCPAVTPVSVITGA